MAHILAILKQTTSTDNPITEFDRENRRIWELRQHMLKACRLNCSLSFHPNTVRRYLEMLAPLYEMKNFPISGPNSMRVKDEKRIQLSKAKKEICQTLEDRL